MFLKRIPSAAILTVLTVVLACLGTSCLAQDSPDTARDHWNRIVAVNTLTAEGNAPFYLKIEFQIFDLKGKPGETGTAEVWWSQHRRYEVIASPSWNWTSAPGEPHQPETRQSYLIEALVTQILQPLRSVKPSSAFRVVEADRKFGSTTLRCLSLSPSVVALPFNTICVDPANDGLRMNTQTNANVMRNQLGKFQDTQVALDLTTTYFEKKAIAAKVVALKSIPTDDDHIKAAPQPAAATGTVKVSTSPGVQAGRKVGGANPVYPEGAKMAHITGSVIIRGTISKEGKLTSPIVIATANDLFNGAALDAVRTWKYEPYLLNGQPTDVDTTIEVNFSLGPRP